MTQQETPPARPEVRSPAARPFAGRGTLLSVGAVAWGIDTLVFGTDRLGTTEQVASMLTGGTFQLGLLGLLSVLSATRALGAGGLARFTLRLEAGLVLLALASTIADGTGVSDTDQVGWALLDACWPISMLGMFVIGIRIAVAGRWHGKARYWPLLAESWAPVVVPMYGLFGSTVAGVVSFVHLCLGYGVLGQIVARQQE